MEPEASGPSPEGGPTSPWPPRTASRPGPAWRRRGGSTTGSSSPVSSGADGDHSRLMAVPSETASSCSTDSATMDVVKKHAGGGDYAMTESHSPATHSQAGAVFGQREDDFPFGLPPGGKRNAQELSVTSVASMEMDRVLSPSASPQTSSQPWSSQHPTPSPKRGARTQSPSPRRPAEQHPRQPSEDVLRSSDDEPHAARDPGWPGPFIAATHPPQQQQMQQALPHAGWPHTEIADHQDQRSRRTSPQHEQHPGPQDQQQQQQQLERRKRREARRMSPVLTPALSQAAPLPVPHPLQLQYQQQCLTDPLFAHPRYRKVCDLNRGAHGFVQRAIDMQTGEEVACKFIERGRKWKPKHLLRELVNQKLCAAHPHIVHLREAFLTPHHLGIAMEYADSGDLLDFIDTFAVQGLTAVPETNARRVFQQMMVAVDYCHRLGIANRDIKLDNVLLSGQDPQLVKLCDFGYSKDGDLESACKTTCGTPEYMAPEVLLGDAYDGQRVDMWSCGCSLYIMLVGNYPFRSMADNNISHVKRMQAMFPRIMAGNYTAIPNGSPEVRDLIHRLLRPNPEERLTMAEVFAHPWFQMDLADGALQLNDTLLAAVGADYAASSDLQERIDILQQAEAGDSGQTVAEMVALVNAAVEPLHLDFFDGRRRPNGLTIATR